MTLNEKVALAEKEGNDLKKVEEAKLTLDHPYIITRFLNSGATETTKLWASNLTEARSIALEMYGIIVKKETDL